MGVTGRALATGGYRIESDEAGELPRHWWWPAVAAGGCSGRCSAGGSATTPGGPPCPRSCFFGWLTVALVWIDADVHRLPDGLVLPVLPRAAGAGRRRDRGPGRLVRAVAGARLHGRDVRPLLRHGLHLAELAGLRRRQALRPDRAAARAGSGSAQAVVAVMVGLPRRRPRRRRHAGRAAGGAALAHRLRAVDAGRRVRRRAGRVPRGGLAEPAA